MRILLFYMVSLIFGSLLQAQVGTAPETVGGDLDVICEDDIRTPLGSTVQVWNWQVEDYTLYLEADNGNERTVRSPWFPNGNDGPTNMELLAIGNPVNFDFKPSDGWELVVKNFGEPGEAINTPFYVLTNRYTGITRGFFYIRGEESAYNTLELGVAHFNLGALPAIAGSGVFNNSSEGLLFPVDEFIVTDTTGFTAFNKAPNVNHWALIQFPAYYDPCVCNSTSLISFIARYSNTVTVDLTISGTSESEAVYEYPSLNSNSPFTGLAKGIGVVQKGFKVYKDLTELNNSLIDFDGDGNDDKKGIKFFSEAVKWLPWISQGVGVAGGVVTVLDQLIGGGKSSGPTLIGYETTFDLKADGNTFEPRSPQEAYVHTPGGNHLETTAGDLNVNPNLIPIYDNPLGVFALLNRPVLNRAGFTNEVEGHERYQLDAASINFALNPAAEINFNPETVKAGLVFVTDRNLSNENLDTYTDPASITGTSAEAEYTSPLIPIGCLSEFTAEFQYNTDPPFVLENGPLLGQRIQSVSLIIIVEGNDQDGQIVPMTIGRYPLKIVDLGNDPTLIQLNPFRGFSLQSLNQVCSYNWVIQPEDPLSLNQFCNENYSSAFAERRGGNNNISTEDFMNSYWGVTKSKNPIDFLVETNQFEEKEPFVVFPNPAGRFTVVEVRTNGQFLIEVIDAQGRVVESRSVEVVEGAVFTRQQFNVSRLPAGIYNVRVSSQDGTTLNERLIVTNQ
ncbi:MAG: T9SS type A sorting domain-containing protein [Bacteroidota bacterium]